MHLAAGLLLIVLVGFVAGTSGGPPLWEKSLGNVGMGKVNVLLSTDARTIYTLWSCNSWAPRPSFFVLALDAATGSMQWNGTLFGAFTVGMECAFSQDDDAVYVTSIYTGTVAALRKTDGVQLWKSIPFQNSSFSLTTYGTVPLIPGVLIAANPQTVLLINASTGAVMPVTEPIGMPSGAPLVVAVGEHARLVFTRSTCYQMQPNLTISKIWSAPSNPMTSLPMILTASSSIAVVSDQVGQGVPRLNATDVMTGVVIWSYITYNTQSSYLWAATVNSDVIALFGSALQFFNASGTLLWELPVANATGTPVMDPTSSYLGVPVQDGAGFAIAVVHIPSGAITQTQRIVDTFDTWYQSAQPIFAASVVAASISSNQQTQPNSFETLVAQSLTPRPPVGVVVHNFQTVDCTGVFAAEVLPTGCHQGSSSNEAVSRICSDNSTVTVTSGASCAQLGQSDVFTLGHCNNGVDGSFRVVSCA